MEPFHFLYGKDGRTNDKKLNMLCVPVAPTTGDTEAEGLLKVRVQA